MRENNGVPSEQDKAKAVAAQAEVKGDISTDITSTEKLIAAAPASNPANNNASNEDISPEGLLNVIS